VLYVEPGTFLDEYPDAVVVGVDLALTLIGGVAARSAGYEHRPQCCATRPQSVLARR